MKEDFSKVIDYYEDQKEKGMDFSEIRKELKARRLADDDIKLIIKEIDNRILFKAPNDSIKMTVNGRKIIGLVLMFVGILITAVTYFGIVDLGGSYLFAYGPIVSGFLLFLQSDDLAIGNGKIKKRKGRSKPMSESLIK